MDIKELDNFRLGDIVKFHDTLNPLLWNSDNQLHDDVKRRLKEIAKDFLDELGISALDVEDVTISGSNAAYSYSDNSDIDLHILVDMHKLPHDEVYRELFTAKKTIYNDTHDITIHGIEVELYVQDSNEPVISLGEYSILKDKWIKIPVKRRANFDQTSSKQKYKKLRSLVKIAIKSKNLDSVNNILRKLKKYRRAGLDRAGEFGPENLAYKMLRNRGYIKKLYDLRNTLHSQDLTLETGKSISEDMFISENMTSISQDIDGGSLEGYVIDTDKPNLANYLHAQGADPSLAEKLMKNFTRIGIIKNLWVDEEMRNKKLGSVLLDRAIDRAYYADAEAILLISDVSEENKFDLTDWYKRYGFEVIGSAAGYPVMLLADDFLNEINQVASEEVNSAVFKRGFEKIKEYGPYTMIAQPGRFLIHQKFNEPSSQFSIKVFKDKLQVAWVNFEQFDDHLEALDLYVDKKHRRKGIATAMYKFAKELGNDIKPSSKQTGLGKQFWATKSPVDESASGYIPSKTFKKLYHVGSLDVSKKRMGSYEGAGLSVSTHPNAWRKIARGHVTGDTYVAIKPANNFIDAHKLTKENKKIIASWAVEEKLIVPAITYRVSYYDDELESVVYSDFESFEDAQREADEGKDIKKISDGFKPTEKLKTLAHNNYITPTGIVDYVLPLYAEAKGYDGVWWQDKLDVSSYSAPRGVIVPSKISDWNFSKIDDVNESASGYIPSNAEKDDPRFKTALTVDVKPDTIQKNAAAFGFKVKRSGIPPLLRKKK